MRMSTVSSPGRSRAFPSRVSTKHGFNEFREARTCRRGGPPRHRSADPQLLSRTLGSVLAINQAEPLFALGRWDEALKIASGAMDLYLAPGPMHRAILRVITGSIALARGDLAGPAQAVLAARDALGSARYEDQHQLPLARLEILLALGKDGPATALAATSQIMDRFELSGSSPRYAWPVVAAGASAVLAAAGLAGVAHDERLRDEAACLAERLRTVAEKLGTFGPAQRAFQLTFAAADAHATRLLAGGEPGPGAGQPDGRPASPAGWPPPGTRPPPRGPASASLTRSARCCCTRPRRRWPAATATERRNGCGAQPRWPTNLARTRSPSRLASSPGAPGSGWLATTRPRASCRATWQPGVAS